MTTVKELIGILEALPPELPVVAKDCQSGGVWHIAPPLLVAFNEALGDPRPGVPAVLIEIA